MTPVEHYNKLTDNWFKRLFRKIARKLGYICIPSDYPLWLNKSATTDNFIAKTHDKDLPYNAGYFTGRSSGFNLVAEEIRGFEKN